MAEYLIADFTPKFNQQTDAIQSGAPVVGDSSSHEVRENQGIDYHPEDLHPDKGCWRYPRCLTCPYPLHKGKCAEVKSYPKRLLARAARSVK